MSFLDILNTNFLSVFHDLTSYSQGLFNFSTDQKDQGIRFCPSALRSAVFLYPWTDLFTTAWTKSKQPPIESPHWGQVYSVKSVFLSLSTHQEHVLWMPPLRALSLLSSEGNLRDMQVNERDSNCPPLNYSACDSVLYLDLFSIERSVFSYNWHCPSCPLAFLFSLESNCFAQVSPENAGTICMPV